MYVESVRTLECGGAPTPSASGFSRGGSGSAMDWRRKSSTASGGSRQNKRFRGNQNQGGHQGSVETRYSYLSVSLVRGILWMSV